MRPHPPAQRPACCLVCVLCLLPLASASPRVLQSVRVRVTCVYISTALCALTRKCVPLPVCMSPWQGLGLWLLDPGHGVCPYPLVAPHVPPSLRIHPQCGVSPHGAKWRFHPAAVCFHPPARRPACSLPCLRLACHLVCGPVRSPPRVCCLPPPVPPPPPPFILPPPASASPPCLRTSR